MNDATRVLHHNILCLRISCSQTFASQALLILQCHSKCGLFQGSHSVRPSTVVLDQNYIIFYFWVSYSVVSFTWNYSYVLFIMDDKSLTARGFGVAYLFSYYDL